MSGSTGDATAPTPPQPAAPTVRAPSKGRRYLTALDGLRAVSAVGVIIIHTESDKHVAISTYIYTGAFAGPFFLLFFAISGFVLYRAWARKHLAIAKNRRAKAEPRVGSSDGGAEGGIFKFLLRRLLRIYPLYWVVATAALIVNHSAGGKHTIVDYVQVYLLLPFPHIHALLDLGLGIVVWTLLIDIVFYLYIGLHGVAVSAFLKRSRADPLQFEVVTLLALAVLFAAIHIITPGPWAALSALPVGMLFAVIDAWQDVNQRRHPSVKFVLRYWWVPMAAYPPLFVFLTQHVIGYHAKDYGDFLVNYLWIQVLLLVYGLFFLATIIWGPRRWPANRLLASQSMVKAGNLTYGTYLWHPVVLALLAKHAEGLSVLPALAITLFGSIALSTVTYQLVEKPLAGKRKELRSDVKPEPRPSGATPATDRP
jgi:peptidoglycan/LPS O-acetylase OafA/YrhL